MAKVSVREKLVAVATQRFHTLGYNACGVQEIVDAAGVPKGSFYNYFKAKELLAREVLSNYWGAARLDVLADTSIAPLERLRQHFEHIAARYEKAGFQNGCLVTKFINEVSDLTPQLQSELKSELDRWAVLIAAVVRDGQADGSISTVLDPGQAARFLIEGWGGATGAMRLSASRGPIDDFLSIAFGVVLKASAPQQRRKVRA
jgi:TetR/AcrR family transcriptional repressor of nem operon